MSAEEDLLIPHRPIGRAFIPARSPLARCSECRECAVLAHGTTRAVARLSSAGVWLWVNAEGTRTVGELPDEVAAGDRSATGIALMSLRRLRALGLVLEADRAPCPPPDGLPGDHAEEGTISVVGSVLDETLQLGVGGEAIDVVITPRGARLPGGRRLVAIEMTAIGPSRDPLCRPRPWSDRRLLGCSRCARPRGSGHRSSRRCAMTAAGLPPGRLGYELGRVALGSWDQPIREPLGDAEWADLRAHVARERLSGLLVSAVADLGMPVTPAQEREVAELEV